MHTHSWPRPPSFLFVVTVESSNHGGSPPSSCGAFIDNLALHGTVYPPSAASVSELSHWLLRLSLHQSRQSSVTPIHARQSSRLACPTTNQLSEVSVVAVRVDARPIAWRFCHLDPASVCGRAVLGAPHPHRPLAIPAARTQQRVSGEEPAELGGDTPGGAHVH